MKKYENKIQKKREKRKVYSFSKGKQERVSSPKDAQEASNLKALCLCLYYNWCFIYNKASMFINFVLLSHLLCVMMILRRTAKLVVESFSTKSSIMVFQEPKTSNNNTD